jgi:hypothetical protein
LLDIERSSGAAARTRRIIVVSSLPSVMPRMNPDFQHHDIAGPIVAVV